MIEGTPARLVMLISMMSVTQFLRCVLLQVDGPGNAQRHGHQAVTIITSTEPTQLDKMPASAGRRDGKLVKNSAFRRGIACQCHVHEERGQHEDGARQGQQAERPDEQGRSGWLCDDGADGLQSFLDS